MSGHSEWVDDLLDRHRWVDDVVRLGWLSRGLVYVVVGISAIPIAIGVAAPTGEASPGGALAQIASLSAGRLLLAVLSTGMLLYIAFQLLSLVLVRSDGAFGWWRRAGHAVAALLYASFAWSSIRIVLSGNERPGPSTIESVSADVLGWGIGRWLVAIAGLVTIGTGAYFFRRHVIQRGFAEGLSDVDPDAGGNDASSDGVLAMGVVGWVGRSMVITLIGFFLVRAAWTFDPSDARGFDRALQQAAESSVGSVFVGMCAVGLLAYGAFCIASHRLRTIEDNESDA